MNFNEMIKLAYRLVFFFYRTITSLTRFIKWNKLFLLLNILINIKVCSICIKLNMKDYNSRTKLI
jgi:hypothetical protein